MRRFVTLNHLFPGTTDSEAQLRALLRQGPAFLRDAEAGGIDGVLIFTANRMPNSFAVAQMIMNETSALIPLIALRADLAHPFEVYSRLLALSGIGQRPIAINLVAGSNCSEQIELGDDCPHDERYHRLAEFAAVLIRLAESGGICDYSGTYYRIETKVRMADPGQLDLRLYVSGSSVEARTLADCLHASRIAPWQVDGDRDWPQGVPLGIIARDNDEAAWRVADAAFIKAIATGHIPELKGNDSHWRERLLDEADQQLHSSTERPVWWYDPYLGTRVHRTGRRSNHVWLVGSYARVANEIDALSCAGVSDLILYQEHANETAHLLKATERA